MGHGISIYNVHQDSNGDINCRNSTHFINSVSKGILHKKIEKIYVA